METSAARELQKRFVPLAERHYDRLVEVLKTAMSHGGQRAKAAWVIGYAPDKAKAAAALDFAVGTRTPGRNNAMRALGVILVLRPTASGAKINAPIDLFLDLVESVEWTDRNKAMLVLDGLSAGRNEAVVAKLRAASLPALVEMARWHTEGHASMALELVGRIAGMSDTEIKVAWDAGKREDVIARGLESASANKSDTK